MKTAIIGLGNIGRVHAKVLSLIGAEIVALSDIEIGRAERIRDEFAPKARVYDDYKVMLERETVDVVHVCTPHDMHAEMVVYLLKKGINTLCEKPLCISERELDAIFAAEAESSAILGVCQQNRYNPSTVFLKKYLEDKKVLGAHGSVVWHRDEKYYRDSPWRASKSRAGGGALINQALHTLDLCQMLAGEPQKVVARAENLAHKGVSEVEDTLTAVFSEGADITFFTTIAAAVDMPIEVTLKLDGGDVATLTPHAVLVNGKTVFEEERRDFHGKVCYGLSHETLISDFYDCIENDREFPITAREAAKVLRLIYAAYKSAEEG